MDAERRPDEYLTRPFADWTEGKLGKLDAIVLCAGETGLDWQRDSAREISRKIDRWVLSHELLISAFLPLSLAVGHGRFPTLADGSFQVFGQL